MSLILGIDLGTSNTCVAIVDERGTPRVLSSPEGERTTPSIVSFQGDGEILTGHAARRQMVTNSERTVYGAKRLIGRKVTSEEVGWFARSAPFKVVAAPNGDAWIRIGAKSLSPQEISSLVLQRIRVVAEQAIGEPLTRAVITVPAYFDEAQRQATLDAGTIAGLDVLRILNEPTAAALAYGAHRSVEQRRMIAVFDLGGGTFDISIMAVEQGIFEVLATDGDSALGGDDWDRRLIERIADEVFDRSRVDLTGNPVALGRLKTEVERAKIDLSSHKQTLISLPYLCPTATGEPLHYERTLTADELDSLTADLLARVEEPCRRAMDAAGLRADEIAEVLLVGGMTRVPAVQLRVQQLFGQMPSKGANPDEVVAQGAAAYGGIISGAQDDAALLDVTPHDIGIKTGVSNFLVLVPRNAMLPVRVTKLVAPARKEQDFVNIELYQGDSDDCYDNRKLGHVTLSELPPTEAGALRIELTVTIDVDSILSVTAKELSTGKKAHVRIKPSGGLSRGQLGDIIEKQRSKAQESLDDE